MRVGLPRALAPRDSVDLDIAWAFQVPPDGAPREGTTGDVFMVAYWYPQIAVYDDVTGWQIDPYLGNAEFYMDYADYDVNLSRAARLARRGDRRADESERGAVAADARSPRRRRSEARASCTSCAMQDRGAGRTKATNTGFDGVLTWRFRARNVRDFDWGASAKFLWDATVAVVGDRDRDGRPDTTAINTFYRPEARAWSWDKSGDYERNVVEFLSNYLWPYPWPQMTALEGPVSCTGMEYPMLTCIGGPRDTLLALLGAGPRDGTHVVPDAGRAPTNGASPGRTRGSRASIRRRGCRRSSRATTASGSRATRYLALARTDSEVPLMRHGDQYPYGHAGVQHRVVRQDGDEHGRAARAARRRSVSVELPDVRAALAVQASDAI